MLFAFYAFSLSACNPFDVCDRMQTVACAEIAKALAILITVALFIKATLATNDATQNDAFDRRLLVLATTEKHKFWEYRLKNQMYRSSAQEVSMQWVHRPQFMCAFRQKRSHIKQKRHIKNTNGPKTA